MTKPTKLRGGYLPIDDTVVEKPYSSHTEGISWVYSSTQQRVVLGYQVVLLVWTNGQRRVIIDHRIYQQGGKTKIELALEMLSYAKNRLKLKPKSVLFDSWYASKKLLKRVHAYGWTFFTQIRKNRKFNGKKLREYCKGPYWQGVGTISGGLKISLAKNGKKYFITNRLGLRRTEILQNYRKRQTIEEVSKQLKFIGIKDCQSRLLKAQSNHICMCIIAYALLERESRRLKISVYKLKKEASFKEPPISDQELTKILKAA